MKEELLDKRLKLEEEYHDLLDRDYPRFTVQDLEEFMNYVDSYDRDVDQEKLFPDKGRFELITDGFNLFDIMNYLHRKRDGKFSHRN